MWSPLHEALWTREERLLDAAELAACLVDTRDEIGTFFEIAL